MTLHGGHKGDTTILLPPSPAPSLPQPPTTLLTHPCAAGEMWDMGQGNAGSHQHSPPPPNLPTEVLPQHPQPTSHPVPKRTGHGTVLPMWPHKVPLASRRGGTEHPHQAPYLAVVRPTVMGTIENPKIDRWNRLEAVSLMVRAAWGKSGVRRWGQFAAGPSSPTVHPSPFLHQLHAAGGYEGACRVS